AFAGGLGAVPLDGGALGRRGDLLHQGVLGGQHHVGGAEEGVGAGGEDANLLPLTPDPSPPWGRGGGLPLSPSPPGGGGGRGGGGGGPAMVKSTSAPTLLPTQLRCISLIASDQSTCSRSSSSRSA